MLLLSSKWRFVMTPHPDTERPMHVPAGFIPSREEWELFKADIEEFYDSVLPNEIKAHNQRLTNPEPRVKSTLPPTIKREGYIYILRSEAGHYKIGKAKDPFNRSQTIGTQHAYRIDLIYIALCLDYTRVERFLHNALATYRMNGEWFNLPPDKLDWLLYHDWIDDAGLGGIVTSMERIPQ